MKSIHVGIAVCVLAVSLFILGAFIFHEWSPVNEQQTVQTTKATATSKKSGATQEVYHTGHLMPIQVIPHYERKNDVEINAGPYSLTATGGGLTDDKKNGALLIHYYTIDKKPIDSDYFISTGGHGALSVYADGTKLRVVAEDGREWKMSFKYEGHINTYEISD